MMISSITLLLLIQMLLLCQVFSAETAESIKSEDDTVLTNKGPFTGLVFPDSGYPLRYFVYKDEDISRDKGFLEDGYHRLSCDRGNVLFPGSCNKNHKIYECRGDDIDQYACERGHPYHDTLAAGDTRDNEHKCKSWSCGTWPSTRKCYDWGPTCFECSKGFFERKISIMANCPKDSYCGSLWYPNLNKYQNYKYCAPCFIGQTSLGNNVKCDNCGENEGKYSNVSSVQCFL